MTPKSLEKNQIRIDSFAQEPLIQGVDCILIAKPISSIWPLIEDSKEMEAWGPPVQRVEIELLPGQEKEGIGAQRKVYAKFSDKRQGWYKEVRTNQSTGNSITFLIYEDSFGMSKLLKDVGGKIELRPVGANQTEFTFTFYHRPRNLFGWLLNPMIRADQKKNRLKALKSIKSYVESGIAIKN